MLLTPANKRLYNNLFAFKTAISEKSVFSILGIHILQKNSPYSYQQ